MTDEKIQAKLAECYHWRSVSYHQIDEHEKSIEDQKQALCFGFSAADSYLQLAYAHRAIADKAEKAGQCSEAKAQRSNAIAYFDKAIEILENVSK